MAQVLKCFEVIMRENAVGREYAVVRVLGFFGIDSSRLTVGKTNIFLGQRLVI